LAIIAKIKKGKKDEIQSFSQWDNGIMDVDGRIGIWSIPFDLG